MVTLVYTYHPNLFLISNFFPAVSEMVWEPPVFEAGGSTVPAVGSRAVERPSSPRGDLLEAERQRVRLELLVSGKPLVQRIPELLLLLQEEGPHGMGLPEDSAKGGFWG